MDAQQIQQQFQLALQHFATGQLRDTEALCRHILSIQPRHSETLHLLGAVANQVGYTDDAIALMRQAISITPQVAEYHSNLAVALTTKGLADEAIASCRQALALNPSLIDAHYNLGNALRTTGRMPEAEQSYRDAVALRFDFAPAHNNLGNVLKEMGRYTEAAAAYRQALFFRPDYAHARSNLAGVLETMGLLDEALHEHRQAVDSAPTIAEVRSNLILCMHYHPAVESAAVREECRRWDERHVRPLQASIGPHANDRSVDRPLRIGYVSADLRTHSVASFLLPLLRSHDRASAHVSCYDNGTITDEVTSQLRDASDAWVGIAGVPDDAVAQRIRADRIDLLVDLGSHTRDNRLLLFARKPAPVQITYLGFPGTTGVSTIDHRLTDALAHPAGVDDLGSEQLARLPESAWCFAPLCEGLVVADLPALRNGYVTFGGFSTLKKLHPDTLRMWSRVLQQVPASRLRMKSAAFREPETVERYQRLFAAQDIDPSRVDLLPDEPLREHLQSHDGIDIALDSYPFHGLTTTCQALWMGVPVVTLAGDRPASRMGVSVLTNAGLAELVAHGADDYVRAATRLAADLPRLAQLRSALRGRLERSALMDAARFTRQLEDTYRALWRRWCERS